MKPAKPADKKSKIKRAKLPRETLKDLDPPAGQEKQVQGGARRSGDPNAVCD